MDRTEFISRVRGCERRLYRVARTMQLSDPDCEDAVQEALLKGWSRLSTLRVEDYFETWLIRILINECRNLYRRKARRETELPPEAAALAGADSCLLESLMALPEKYRIPLELHYIEGYKTREIARMLSIPESTVKWRLVKGRDRLRAELKEEEA